MPASELAAARVEIAKLQRVLGKKTLENKILKEAVEYAAEKNVWSRFVLRHKHDEHAARHADKPLISHVLASYAPSIFRKMRHCTFVCMENAPLYFRFFDQQGGRASYRPRRKRSVLMCSGVAGCQGLSCDSYRA